MKRMKKWIGLLLALCVLTTAWAASPVAFAEGNDGADHTHQWEEGVCTVCGQRCAHIWENGVCSVCGLPLWVNGICRDCGEEHSHTFISADDPCTICGYVCPHVSHDRYTLKCDKCGYVVNHEFGEDGVCVKCSYATNVYQYGSVDNLYVKDCAEKGKVVQLEYKCIALAGKQTGSEITKKLNVYLPYGYTEEKQYNVYYYLHGAFGTINDIIRPNEVTDTEKFLNNIIAEKVCDPFILVCPTWFDSDVTAGDLEGTLQENFNIQLRDSIIPAVESTYSTYLDCDGKIENVTPEKIAASRDHRAIGGFSGGATVTAMMAVYGIVKHNVWFSKGACISSAVHACMDDLMQDLWNLDINPDTRAYLSWGSVEAGCTDHDAEDHTSHSYHCNRAVAEGFRERGARAKLRCQVGGGHCEADWEKLVPEFMNFLWLDQ